MEKLRQTETTNLHRNHTSCRLEKRKLVSSLVTCFLVQDTVALASSLYWTLASKKEKKNDTEKLTLVGHNNIKEFS
jgi:hypothetical protein